VARYLAEARPEGWELEGSISFLILLTQGRVRYQARYGAITGEWKYTDYISVVVRLRRTAETRT